MSLTTPPSVQKLQTALHAKAKESPKIRFHALYDKVYRKDVLASGRAITGFPEASLHALYGLAQLPHRTASLPWASA